MSQEEELLQGETNGHVTVQNSDRIERSDVTPMLSPGSELPGTDNENHNCLTITRKYVPVIRMQKPIQCQNKKRTIVIILGCMFVFLSLVFLVTGTIRFHQCQPQKVVTEWDKRFLGFHFDDLVGLNNYALEKSVNQTSMAYLNSDGPAQLAVDGDIKTCSRTDAELLPRLQIDLKYQRPIGFVLVHGNAKNALHDITIHIAKEEVTTNTTLKHIVCKQIKGFVKNQVIAADCGRPLNGRLMRHKLPKRPSAELKFTVISIRYNRNEKYRKTIGQFNDMRSDCNPKVKHVPYCMRRNCNRLQQRLQSYGTIYIRKVYVEMLK